MTSTIITVALIAILIAALPMWKYSKPFGYTPTIWVGVMLAAHFYSIATAT
jgi:fucose permease